MAAPARTLLSELPKGHELNSATFDVGTGDIESYLAAVGDSNNIYASSGLAPPLALAARALGTLLETLELPAGTLHTGQEIDVRGGLPIAGRVSMRGRIVQRSERAGLVIAVLEFDLTADGASEPGLTGRTTVAMPAGGQGNPP
jgi:hypothetical protein